VLRELYVYWKTDTPAVAQAACLMLQRRLVDQLPGLQAETLAREDSSRESTAGRTTLMEIYRHPKGIDSAMEQCINELADSALREFQSTPRVVECFVPCGLKLL
jgi:Domain of unknown function (DUF4936)